MASPLRGGGATLLIHHYRTMSDASVSPALVLGLGNPGDRYRDSRHNLGFRVARELARRRGVAIDRLECNALTAADGDLILAMPQTYMNRSGYAARCLVERHGLEPERVLVVYDDVALPLGQLRLRRSGGPGGHRGMESVIASLRTEAVPRLRLGILGERTPGGDELSEWVLTRFERDEIDTVDAMVGRAAEACLSWQAEGVDTAMNRFNG